MEIPAYDHDVTLTLTPINDALNEGDEQATLTATGAYACSCGCGCGGPFGIDQDQAEASVTIADDDDWTVGISTDVIFPLQEMDYEWDAFTVTRSGGSDLSYGMLVDFVMSGEAERDKDYWLLYPDWRQIWGNTVEIPAGHASVDFLLQALNDPLDETVGEDSLEAAICTLGGASSTQCGCGCGCGAAYGVDPAFDDARIAIADDDDWTIGVKGTLAVLLESDAGGLYTIFRKGGQDDSYAIVRGIPDGGRNRPGGHAAGRRVSTCVAGQRAADVRLGRHRGRRRRRRRSQLQLIGRQ